MAPTIRGSRGHGDAPRLPDHLLHLQKVKTSKSIATAEQQLQPTGEHAPDPTPWRHQLPRLAHLEQDLALLPVGWGPDRKGPMLEGWQHHLGYTLAQLQAHRSMRSVGARTGLLTGPLLCFDFDGATSRAA